MKDHYCSQKFFWLQVDAEKKEMRSCCKADPTFIDKSWLENNPGQLFNSPELIKDRQLMLAGERVNGCEVCWDNEDKGTWSRRKAFQSDVRTHTDLYNTPEILNLHLTNDCNLTCSYCCKHYSSSWRTDLIDNGTYTNLESFDDTYKATKLDIVLSKLSQKDKNKLSMVGLVDREISLWRDTLKEVLITGGEPFLNLKLPELISKFSNNTEIKIWSGLGISESVLRRNLDSMADKNIILVLSAESTGDYYNFNRYGNTWDKFLRYLDIINSEYDIKKIWLNMTISNLTVFDYVNFNRLFPEYEKGLTFAHKPDFFDPSNLDRQSKDSIIENILSSEFAETQHSKYVIDSLNNTADPAMKLFLKSFLDQFCQRRNINYDFMPDSFKTWINS